MNSAAGDRPRRLNHSPGANRSSSNRAWRDRLGGRPPRDSTELKYRAPENILASKLAKGLGFFSVVLGLTELLAPGPVGRMIGVSNKYRKFLPLLGIREVAHGVGILNQTKPTTAVWSRVIGDGVDLGFLATALSDEENNATRLTCATAAVMSVAALDVLCATMLSSQEWSESVGHELAPTTLGQSSGRQLR